MAVKDIKKMDVLIQRNCKSLLGMIFSWMKMDHFQIFFPDIMAECMLKNKQNILCVSIMLIKFATKEGVLSCLIFFEINNLF